MEQYRRKRRSEFINIQIDLSTIWADLRRNLWSVLCISVACSIAIYMIVGLKYKPTYSMHATYVVSTKGVNNNTFTNLTSAQSMANKFSQIFRSDTMRKKVLSEEKLAEGEVVTIYTEVVPETNLLNLYVQAETPERAYHVLHRVMTEYPELAKDLLHSGMIRVLVSPVIPNEADYRPSSFRKACQAFILSLGGLCLLLIMASCLKDTVRKGTDVEEKLGTYYIGSVCHEHRGRRGKHKKGSRNSLLITRQTISMRFVETMNKVCRRVQNNLKKNGAKSLLITSYLENEGKSTIAANLALLLAEQGRKVVLVDLDLRLPAQYKVFDLSEDTIYGLGDMLSGGSISAHIIGKIPDTEVYTAFNNQSYNRSTEMLSSGKLKELLQYLKEEFDYIIIDTPPIAVSADAEVIAEYADASMIVVREHIARTKDINNMLDMLEDCPAKVIGCVVNDSHTSVGSGIGGYGYGSEYGYGYEYGRYYNNYSKKNRKKKERKAE